MIARITYEINRLYYRSSKLKRSKYSRRLKIDEIKREYKSLTSQYLYFHHFFWNIAPGWLRDHRSYFSKDKRGFGEDAFHAMWYLIFNEFKPKNILEIGIYRGQSLSLFSLLSKEIGYDSEIHGISPFTSAGDSVSKYLESLNYYDDVLINFAHFNLPSPVLHKGFSSDGDMIKVIQSRQWDLIFIDGNHSYEVAKQDFEICSSKIRKGGLIVLDDSSLYTNYKAPLYSTAGHPGPSKVASEINLSSFEEILSVGHNRAFKKR